MSIITKDSELNELCREIDSCGRFGVDLEFIPERTYKPELCLVQVATESNVYIVDPYGVSSLTELWKRVADPSILVVLHAGDQDLDLIYQDSALLPANISDTQIAAAFIGFGYPVGYGKLVQQLLGVSITKAESYTDWTNRPLTKSQVAYALDDVRHLLPLHDAISEKLDHSGRRAWVEDECRRYCEDSYYEKDRSKDFMRFKGASGLSRRSLGVLRSLSEWRHGEAARINRPLRSILPDNVIFEFARHPPRSLDDVQRIRGVRADQLRNYGDSLLKAVKAAMELPDSELPQWPASRVPSRRDVLTADFLFTILKVLVYDLDLAPELVTTRANLEQLVRMKSDDELMHSRLPLLQGWRYELVGKHLLNILQGAECRVRLNDATPPLTLQIDSK